MGRAAAVICAALVAVLCLPTVAPAHPIKTQRSHNWAGYAVTAKHPFTEVRGSWVEPRVDCSRKTGDSAFWIGLGGFAAGERKPLEQIGTYANCNGRAGYSAFSVIYPYVGDEAGIRPHPGDQIAARIVVRGNRVRMTLADRTTNDVRSYSYPVLEPNTTSAEWIAESPASSCARFLNCVQVLPLADFGQVTFSGAEARLKGGRSRPAGDSGFLATRLRLHDRPGERFGRPEEPVIFGALGEAIAGALAPSGRSFDVTWKR
jgi:hypothetical protein